MKRLTVLSLILILFLTGCEAKPSSAGNLLSESRTADEEVSGTPAGKDSSANISGSLDGSLDDSPDDSFRSGSAHSFDKDSDASTDGSLDGASDSQNRPESKPILLMADKQEIEVDSPDGEILFECQTDMEFDSLKLVDSATLETVPLTDDGHYGQSGDRIMGDGIYSCRIIVDTSAERDLSYYASCSYHSDDGKTACSVTSDALSIMVYAVLTDEALNDMKIVEQAIEALMNNAQYKQSSDTEQTKQLMTLLNTLSESGTPDAPYSLIRKDSILDNGDIISFSYRCGALGGVKRKPFDPYMN